MHNEGAGDCLSNAFFLVKFETLSTNFWERNKLDIDYFLLKKFITELIN